MDEPDPTKAGADRNLGLYEKSKFTLTSNEVGLIGIPFCDI